SIICIFRQKNVHWSCELMQKRFFVVAQRDKQYELRELDPQIGHSIQQYGSVCTGHVDCHEHRWMFLFMHPPAADSDMLAANLCEAMIAGEQPVKTPD
ncbi:MAG: hypothetical protein ACPG7F_19910, partial [Aggregatilineales bacterium]